MTSRPAILAASFAALAACTGAREPAKQDPAPSDMSHKTPPPSPGDPAKPEPASSDMSPKTPTTNPAAAALEGYPLARLKFEHNQVEPLDLPLPGDAWKKAGATSYQAFTATTPRVWLLVFEFPDQRTLLGAIEEPGRALGLPEPPYYTATSFTGAWLLVTGFPSDKPVSPEMEAARTIFLQRWAGEE